MELQAMSLIINPGSGAVALSGEGWTNTAERARLVAEEWLARIHAEGITEVELLGLGTPDGEGRWRFGFRHLVTGVIAELVTPGIDDWEAFTKKHIFGTRTYWNGSSSAEPRLSDWEAEGYEPFKTFVRAAGRSDTGEAGE